MTNLFPIILVFLSLSLFASESNEYGAKIKWDPISKIRIEAVYKNDKLIAERVYNNFELAEVFVNGKRTGKNEEAAKQYDSFIQKVAQEKKEVTYYGDMRQETIGLFINGQNMQTIAQKILVDKTNELREVFVKGRAWNSKDKDAVKETDSIFKKYADNNEKLAHKKTCEEITESYVICNGNRYVLDIKNDDRLKRDIKQIEERISPVPSGLTTDTVQK